MNAMTPIRSRKGRKAKPAAITLPTWDKGAEGAANQERRRRQSWVQIYARKGWITQTQLLAAERLARAAEGFPDRDPLAAVFEGRGTDGFDPQAAAVDARAEFRRLWALVPAASKPVMQRVVLEDEAVWKCNDAQRERHISRLKAGLDAIS